MKHKVGYSNVAATNEERENMQKNETFRIMILGFKVVSRIWGNITE